MASNEWTYTRLTGERGAPGGPGASGNSIYVQYSKDGSTGWHDTFASDDFYMRQRVGATGEWSASMRIVGEAGHSPTVTATKSGTATTIKVDGVTQATVSDGSPGTSPTVTSTAIAYAQSTSGTAIPTSGWQSSPPTATAGYFMWTRITTTYSDGKTSVGYAVGKNGTNGSPGTTPWAVTCGEPSISIPCGTGRTASSAKTVTVEFSAFQGTTRKACTGAYGTLPSGVSCSVTAGTASAAGSFKITIASGATLGGTDATYDTVSFPLYVTANSVKYTFTCCISKSVQGAVGSGVSKIETLYSIGDSTGSKTTATAKMQQVTGTYPVQYFNLRITKTDSSVQTTSPVPIGTQGIPGAVGCFVSDGILYLTA